MNLDEIFSMYMCCVLAAYFGYTYWNLDIWRIKAFSSEPSAIQDI